MPFRMDEAAPRNNRMKPPMPSLFQMPPCALQLLHRGARYGLEPVSPISNDSTLQAWAAGTGISHVYVLHYRGNPSRKAYQQVQIAQLGLPASIVTAYDKQDIGAELRNCSALCDRSNLGIFRALANQSSICSPEWSARLSASLKLYVAIFDMAWNGFAASLICEDDVKIIWQRLGYLSAAVRNTSHIPFPDRLTVLFSSSYSANGRDGLCCEDSQHHVHPRPDDRFGFGLMPAVGVVVSSTGARHLLESLPITDNNDVLLSDRRGPAGRQRGLWYSKPFTFVPAPELQFECISALEHKNCKPAISRSQLPMPQLRPGFRMAQNWSATIRSPLT